jgi:hypothetical protein
VNNIKIKICSKCKKELPITEFHKGTNKDGLHCWCKLCNKKFRETAEYGEYYRTYKKQYYKKHKKEILKQVKKYQNSYKYKEYQKSAKAVYRALVSSAKIRHIELFMTEKDFINWYNSQEQKCYYCSRNLKQIQQDNHYHRTNKLTIDRKNNDKGYTLDNIVLACWICNNVKSNLFNEIEMLIIGNTLKNILI